LNNKKATEKTKAFGLVAGTGFIASFHSAMGLGMA